MYAAIEIQDRQFVVVIAEDQNSKEKFYSPIGTVRGSPTTYKRQVEKLNEKYDRLLKIFSHEKWPKYGSVYGQTACNSLARMLNAKA